ncbi:MAG: nucleotidyltransferase domain-containing protein [Betaproteobacteria bacterium]|nr:nucleotidyltransferase domain-containing protein [Betaproteobacteria bacterium]
MKTPPISLATHLLGNTRSAVLVSLLLHPESALHVRELARITGASPGSLHRELRALTELGLLLRQETGRQVHYRANQTCPIFEDMAGLLRKTAGVADVLREALMPLAEQITLAFVYGSVATGRAGPRSDVDVMVLGRAGFAPVVKVLAPTQQSLRREVNAAVMKPGDFARKRLAGDGFVASVIREPKLWLIGNDDDLAELTQDRPT